MRPAGMNSPRRVVRIATSFASSGFAQRDGERLKVPANLLTVLRQRDLDGVSRTLAAETGLSYRPLEDGERITGVYRRMVVAASGRFAMLDDGLGFSLVPWRPVLEQRIGQQLGATLRGDHVIWSFGRSARSFAMVRPIDGSTGMVCLSRLHVSQLGPGSVGRRRRANFPEPVI